MKLSDTQRLFDLTDKNREYLGKYLTWVEDVKSVSDTAKFVETSIAEFETGASQAFCIIHKEEIVGTISLMIRDNQTVPTHILGYWIDERS